MKASRLFLGIMLAGATALAGWTQTYVLASPSATLNSEGWALEGANLAEFRTAISNPVYFGPNGMVGTTVSTLALTEVSRASLANVSGLMVPWWGDAQSANYETIVKDAFLAGMDLWILQDDPSHDGVGASLGISSLTSNGAPSNGNAPFFNGPFGVATNTGTYGNFATFDVAAVAALGGAVFGTNTSGQATVVAWSKGAFAPGAGALLIFSDVDMISNWGGQHYSPTLDGNGVLALNSMAWLAQGATAVPEPSTYALLGCGLVLVWIAARRKRR